MEEALREMDGLLSLRRRALCEQPVYRGVSLPQLHILLILSERERMTVSELAALLSISIPSASAIADRMEENDLVSRERDVSDRRVVHISIADHGREVVDNLVGMQKDKVRRLLDMLTMEELDHVVQAMSAIRRAVERVQERQDPASAQAS